MSVWVAASATLSTVAVPGGLSSVTVCAGPSGGTVSAGLPKAGMFKAVVSAGLSRMALSAALHESVAPARASRATAAAGVTGVSKAANFAELTRAPALALSGATTSTETFKTPVSAGCRLALSCRGAELLPGCPFRERSARAVVLTHCFVPQTAYHDVYCTQIAFRLTLLLLLSHKPLEGMSSRS